MEWKNLTKKIIRLSSLVLLIFLTVSCKSEEKDIKKQEDNKANVTERKEPEKPKGTIELKGNLRLEGNGKDFKFYVSDDTEKKILNDFKEPFLDFTADYKSKDLYKVSTQIRVTINDEIEFAISDYNDLKAGKKVILNRYKLKDKSDGVSFELNKNDKLYDYVLKICNLIVEKNK